MQKLEFHNTAVKLFFLCSHLYYRVSDDVSDSVSYCASYATCNLLYINVL